MKEKVKPSFAVGDLVKSKSGPGYSDNAEGVVTWSSDREVEVQLTKAKRKKDVNKKILYQSWEISYLTDNKERVKSLYAATKLPKALVLLSKLCMIGDNKHGKGPIKHDVDYDAKIQAHLVRYLSGEELDRETKMPHLVAVAFNALAKIETELSETDLEELLK